MLLKTENKVKMIDEPRGIMPKYIIIVDYKYQGVIDALNLFVDLCIFSSQLDGFF